MESNINDYNILESNGSKLLVNGPFGNHIVSKYNFINRRQIPTIRSSTNKGLYFTLRAKSIHGDHYLYDNIVYINATTKVEIICPIHGSFYQTPANHQSGFGCSKCGEKSSNEAKVIDYSDFIKRAKNSHSNIYEYDEDSYSNIKGSIRILCKKHGWFEQSCENHTRGNNGCQKCAQESLHLRSPIWSRSQWRNAGINSNNFNGFKLYVISCYNNEESFIKIGRTFNSIKDRFGNSSRMPYQYNIEYILSEDSDLVYDIENDCKSEFSDDRYLPKIMFGGMYECYKKSVIIEVVDYITKTTSK